MQVRILLPFRVFAEWKDVKRLVVPTAAGLYGFWPQRLDCTAIVVPGIITCETQSGGVQYMALNEGVLTKAGTRVWIAVRNAVGNAPLGKLKEVVEKEMRHLDEREIAVRSVMAKLERGFVRSLEKLRKE